MESEVSLRMQADSFPEYQPADSYVRMDVRFAWVITVAITHALRCASALTRRWLRVTRGRDASRRTVCRSRANMRREKRVENVFVSNLALLNSKWVVRRRG